MSDYWLKEAERRGDEAEAYGDWVNSNEDFLIEQWTESSGFEYPEEIYEGYLDDDYETAEDVYVNNLTINDVPDDFIQNAYNNYLEDN